MSRRQAGPRTLCLDVGGTGLKASVLDPRGRLLAEPVRVPTPYPCTPRVLAAALAALARSLPPFDRVSAGFPGVVREGRVMTAPHFGNELWRGCRFAAALARRLGKPVRLLNDAEVQGLAAISGQGLELVVTLGTGVGTALFRDGKLAPHLELAHHPAARGLTYNEYIGDRARRRIGDRRWNRRVRSALDQLRTLINFDQVHVGGGNALRLKLPPQPGLRISSNLDGILGGIALWRGRPPL